MTKKKKWCELSTTLNYKTKFFFLSLLVSLRRMWQLPSSVNVLFEQGEDFLIGLVDLFSLFGAGQDYFTAGEDEKHDLGRVHAEDETREKLGVVSAHFTAFFYRLVVQRL